MDSWILFNLTIEFDDSIPYIKHIPSSNEKLGLGTSHAVNPSGLPAGRLSRRHSSLKASSALARAACLWKNSWSRKTAICCPVVVAPRFSSLGVMPFLVDYQVLRTSTPLPCLVKDPKVNWSAWHRDSSPWSQAIFRRPYLKNHMPISVYSSTALKRKRSLPHYSSPHYSSEKVCFYLFWGISCHT